MAMDDDLSDRTASRRTGLALYRTRQAADRTLLAWIRTSLSMISFGFGIVKFFQYLKDVNVEIGRLPMHGPMNLGTLLVVLGIALLGLAIVEYLMFMRQLKNETGRKMPVSLALIAACMLTVLGFLALLNIMFRIGPI
jgi:putative membrane protein